MHVTALDVCFTLFRETRLLVFVRKAYPRDTMIIFLVLLLVNADYVKIQVYYTYVFLSSINYDDINNDNGPCVFYDSKRKIKSGLINFYICTICF